MKDKIKTAKKADVYNAYALESAFKLLNQDGNDTVNEQDAESLMELLDFDQDSQITRKELWK